MSSACAVHQPDHAVRARAVELVAGRRRRAETRPATTSQAVAGQDGHDYPFQVYQRPDLVLRVAGHCRVAGRGPADQFAIEYNPGSRGIDVLSLLGPRPAAIEDVGAATSASF